MSAAALQKMMESALMPVEMTSFLLECQSSLDCVSFFPWVQDHHLGGRQEARHAEAREVEDIKKPGRECTLDLDQDHREQRLLDVSTSQSLAKPNLATCQRNVQ